MADRRPATVCEFGQKRTVGGAAQISRNRTLRTPMRLDSNGSISAERVRYCSWTYFEYSAISQPSLDKSIMACLTLAVSPLTIGTVTGKAD